MSHRLVCSCGKEVVLEAGESATVCPECGTRVSAGAEGKVDSHDEEMIEPVSVENVTTEKGACWKLVCPCNKRILVPQKAASATGRCPKCGRLLRLPSRSSQSKPSPVSPEPPPRSESASRAHAPLPATDDDDLSDLVLDIPPSPSHAPRTTHQPPAPAPIQSECPKPPEPEVAAAPRIEEPASRAAALRTADILRSSKVSERTPGPGLISAWPLAGRLPRALAGFIDLTLGMIAATLIIIGGSLGLLPENSRYLVVPVVAFFTAVLLNDCLLQAFGGSIGKRLVVLTLRTPDGLAPSIPIILLRAFIKWLLFPGWLVALVHPAQRSLHDLICNTYVMKGRVRHG
jgi:uncharacterized RDD family membrane protein YckC